MQKKTRFAPSPSGFLHIGGARTALTAWLMAKNMGGNFVLRIEDSDSSRSTDKSADSIISTMRALGLGWDEGPGKGSDDEYYQSRKLHKYRSVGDALLNSGLAYKCFCPEERITRLKENQRLNKIHPKYDGRCRNVSSPSVVNAPYCIRLKVIDQEICFTDAVVGKVTFQSSNFEDMVIIRTNGYPTYNFACAVDDMEMGITHVVRGNEHLPNTPKQILIYQALKASLPKFVHLPLILDKDTGRKMSKRDNGVSVNEIGRASCRERVSDVV
jgi:glutamyl-tRNA synthetase